jgi:hypothetical protein
MSKKPYTKLICLLLLGTLAPLAQATLVYNFDDGTLQGFTSIMQGGYIDRGDSPGSDQTMGEFRLAITSDTERRTTNGTIGTSIDPWPAHSGSHYLFPKPYYDRDPNTNTLLMRSPAFTLDGSGDLTVAIGGGEGGAATLSGTSAAVSATTTSAGFQGVALRRVSDDTYVLSGRRSGNATDFQLVSLAAASIASATAGDASGEAYTLDLVDARHGGWGWSGFDSISIPGAAIPEAGTANLFVIGFLLLGLQRSLFRLRAERATR